MKGLVLLRYFRYCRVGNPAFLLRPETSYGRACSTQRFTSSLASQKLPTSLHYEKTPSRPTTEQANLDLVNLVENAQYGEAERRLLHLSEIGIKVQRHHTFEKAAVSALQWDNNEKCLEQFSTWFSLVPNADEAFPPSLINPFQNIRHALLRSGVLSTKLPVIRRFGMICASKGYTEPILREVFQCITRFEKPKLACDYMLDIERAATQYQLDRDPARATAVSQKYRALAVEICAQLGWFHLVSKIIRIERDFPLPDRTNRFLLEQVRLSKGPFVKGLVAKARRDLQMSLIGGKPHFPRRVGLEQTHTDDAYASPDTPRQDYPSPMDPWEASVDNLRKNFRAPFLEPASSLKLQSLLISNIRREPLRVLDVYSANFEKLELGSVFDHTLSRLLASIPHPEPKAPIPFPLSIDLHWIIFRSIIDLSSSLPWPLATIESLYDSFLSRPYILVAHKVFAAFISAFGRCGGLDQAQMVIYDMRQLGFMPYANHFGRLAGAYAWAGKVDQAMSVIDELERPGLFNSEASRRFEPQYATYGRVIEGFMKAGMLEPALTVKTRMMHALPYIRGKHPSLDRVLDTLQMSQSEASC